MVMVVALGCGSATCLYSGAGPVDPISSAVGGSWHPALAAIADLLTVAIPTAGIADVRDCVLVLFLGAILLLAAVGLWTGDDGEKRRNIETSKRRNIGTSKHQDVGTLEDSSSQPETRNPRSAASESTRSAIAGVALPDSIAAGAACCSADRWILWTCAGVTVLALLSALGGDELELSWGWIARFTAGAAWAYFLARWFTAGMVRATLPAILAIGMMAIALGFAHRADRGYLHLSWPIGPITLTAAVAGCWAAMAVAWVVGRALCGAALQRSRPWGVLVVALPAAAISVAALVSTGRRASAIGLLAALVVVIVVLTVRRYPGRGVRAGVGLLLLLGVAGVGAYVVREARSADRVRSGPVRVRLAYLEQSWGLIRERPLLGVGPDQFVVSMTQRMAPLRASSPQVYHGNIDNAAHNEWVQAAVELGVPGGLLYLAMPVGIGLMGLRRLWRGTHTIAGGGAPSLSLRAGSGDRIGGESCDACTLALLAGLVAICVPEAAGITLRGPVMPVWYWTLLGLLAAQCRNDGISSEGRWRGPVRGLGRPWVAVGAAAMCFFICFVDLYGATRPILVAPGVRLGPAYRLYAEKTIEDYYAVAEDAMEFWRQSPSAGALDRAIDDWRRMYELLPSYLDTPARYAEGLVWAKRNDEARAVLERAISELNPYDFDTNTLYATLVADPIERLRCVQRGLRSAALAGSLQNLLDVALDRPEVEEVILGGLPAARAAAAGHAEDALLRDATVELLRIAAYGAERKGNNLDAIADQRLIADCYRRLEETSHPYRRPSDAEADAWLTLARLIYTHDRDNWREAFESVRRAERYAIMGIRHESVAGARPEAGYLGGEVVPTEFPERLYPLWQLSALLHVISGEDRFLDLRIFAGLPPTRWTQRDLAAELARLARQAHADLSVIPTEARPAHYDGLLDMARHYELQIAGS